jgi:hypothetical protein
MKPAIIAPACYLALVACGLVSAFFHPVSVFGQEENSASGASHLSSPAIPVIAVDFSNPGLSPSHWTLSLHPDGSGHFRSEMGSVAADSDGEMQIPNVNRDIQLSPRFAETVFETAQHHSWFNESCESHLKVAFQGIKTLSYSGPDGSGSCAFNFSRDKDIQGLGDSFVAVAETILEGVRLEMLLQHDPLGLDREIQTLSQAAQDGRAQQICVIRGILERLAQDDNVLEMVRKRARTLLARAET